MVYVCGSTGFIILYFVILVSVFKRNFKGATILFAEMIEQNLMIEFWSNHPLFNFEKHSITSPNRNCAFYYYVWSEFSYCLIKIENCWIIRRLPSVRKSNKELNSFTLWHDALLFFMNRGALWMRCSNIYFSFIWIDVHAFNVQFIHDKKNKSDFLLHIHIKKWNSRSTGTFANSFVGSLFDAWIWCQKKNHCVTRIFDSEYFVLYLTIIFLSEIIKRMHRIHSSKQSINQKIMRHKCHCQRRHAPEIFVVFPFILYLFNEMLMGTIYFLACVN